MAFASAVVWPQQSAFRKEAYPTIALKTAAFMQSLAENQPFVDGNKRLAWACGKLFLQLHDFTMNGTDEEGLTRFLERVAQGMTVEELAEWIGRHASDFSNAPGEPALETWTAELTDEIHSVLSQKTEELARPPASYFP